MNAVKPPLLYLAANRRKLITFLAPNAKLRAEIVPGEPVNANYTTDDLEGTFHPMTSARMSWARLLNRVFDIDIEHCPRCGSTMKIIAAIEQPAVIIKIIDHLGLPTREPLLAPVSAFDFVETA